MAQRILASEQVGQLFVETARGRDRIEYTEYGSGDAWVVLVPPVLAPRRVQARLARSLAASGLHVVVPDLLGHGRSDRPADPLSYSVTAFAEQVVALLDHLGAAQAVLGGTALGANVALEAAALAPTRVRGLLLDAPVLDDALAIELAVLAPLMYVGRFVPLGVHAARWATLPVPRRLAPRPVRRLMDALDQRPGALAALAHGVLFGRLGPSYADRAGIGVPALVVARPRDPFHPASDAEALAEQLPQATLEVAAPLEWRRSPERLDLLATRFALDCSRGSGIRRPRRGGA
ncbi:alpha/beta hydrolase [Nocardioides sp. YIM 152588]|uniref:alpha/beta fold hydrolase n=1 Tax=Nocardioides sp. YIM 152588 TaxID=3158259 RepID=UPI0032E52349